MFIDFRERERESETLMWETNIDWLPPILTPTEDQTRNRGMCPDYRSYPQPFGVQDNAPTNQATQPGLYTLNIFPFYLSIILQ